MQSDGIFDWDEQNIAHIARHKVTPAEFEQVVANDPIHIDTHVDENSGEARTREIGHTNALRVLEIVWTLRRKLIRPVSAWTAARKIRAAYFANRGL